MGCGDIKFLEGGVINGSTIVNSQISNSTMTTSSIAASTISKSDVEEVKVTDSEILQSTISNSVLENSAIRSMTQIDAQSAKVIADAISVLPKADLVALASALFAALQIPAGDAPLTNEDGDISAKIIGGTGGTLGAPVQWGTFGEFVVPMYKPGE